MIRLRLRRLAIMAGRGLISVAVAAAAAAAAIWLTSPGRPADCASFPSGEEALPIPTWILVSGAPAVVAFLIGAYFALGIERTSRRLLGLLFSIALGGAVFYAAYQYLPATCRP